MARDMNYTNYVDSNAIKSGFFNSTETDVRTYDAEDLSSIFDGIITDGVYASVGSAFSVTANSGMIINIGTGRAWFKHVWLNVSSIVSIELDEASPYLDRYDAVAIEINKNTSEKDKTGKDRGRQGNIVVITGLGAENPQKPEMIHDGVIDQYPLAYIKVTSNAEAISDSDIEKCVGVKIGEEIPTPFVESLQPIDISSVINNYESRSQDVIDENQELFDDWFENLQVQLDDNVAANLQDQINDILSWINNIGVAEEEEY